MEFIIIINYYYIAGFKREQLKVQLNDQRILTIHGQRSLDENKWTRFTKQIKIPEDCNENKIRAKFASGILSLIMPKRVISPPDRLTSGNTKPETNNKISDQAFNSKDRTEKGDKGSTKLEGTEPALMETKSRRLLKMGAKFASVVLVLVVSGAYVNCVYKKQSCSQN